MKTHITPCPTAKSNAGALSPLTECARVVIADPYPVIRAGLTTVLEAAPDFRIVATCADSASCIKAIQEFLPDIAIVDVSLSEIHAVISSEGLPTRIVFFTALEEREQRLFHARGVHAVVRKDADPQSLLQTLRQVASGQKVLQLPLYCQAESGEDAEKAITAMTDRERQIMRLVSEGLSNKEIGRRLHITDGTIKVHLHRIFQKLVVGNRTALAALYLSNRGSGKQEPDPA
jgi:two-component system, NarL family, nitrate/nitrite response regulator NarL